jgi:predicted transcriptional regulator
MTDAILPLTAQIVAAYLGHNELASGEIPALISVTYTALLQTASPVSRPVERQLPAVPVKKSVTPDAVVCLECGKPQKMLKRHLSTAHGVTVEDYRAKWSLPSNYPMVAPNYATVRSEMAKKIGLGRKPNADASKSEGLPRTELSEEKPPYKYPASRWSIPTQ